MFILNFTNGDTIICAEEFIKAFTIDYRQKGHELWSCKPFVQE